MNTEIELPNEVLKFFFIGGLIASIGLAIVYLLFDNRLVALARIRGRLFWLIVLFGYMAVKLITMKENAPIELIGWGLLFFSSIFFASQIEPALSSRFSCATVTAFSIGTVFLVTGLIFYLFISNSNDVGLISSYVLTISGLVLYGIGLWWLRTRNQSSFR